METLLKEFSIILDEKHRAINERDITIKQLQENLLEIENERNSLKLKNLPTKHIDNKSKTASPPMQPLMCQMNNIEDLINLSKINDPCDIETDVLGDASISDDMLLSPNTSTIKELEAFIDKSFYSASKPKKEHSREANLSGQISILLENSMVSREQALPVFMQAEINNEIPQSVSPPGNDNATSDLENNKSETQSIEQFKPTTTTTTTTTKAIHKKGEKNRAGQNRTMRNKEKFGNKVNNDNDNSSTHSLKPKQKGEIKINKNNTPPTSNNHREISEIASVNIDRFKDNQT
ncbi:Hypothetical predicted protein [Paramuricea clavata]|uniref:Uncharacterized protein n=1 Tax=Paramuricea clavata TaxID=317549 RepID=A0A6S7IGD7_PARCT|nr:Hypothetical predicted protein [Paramuricea clavata]